MIDCAGVQPKAATVAAKKRTALLRKGASVMGKMIAVYCLSEEQQLSWAQAFREGRNDEADALLEVVRKALSQTGAIACLSPEQQDQLEQLREIGDEAGVAALIAEGSSVRGAIGGSASSEAKLAKDAPPSRSGHQKGFNNALAKVTAEDFKMDAATLRSDWEKNGERETGSGVYSEAILVAFKHSMGGNKSNRNVRRDVLAFLEKGTPFTKPSQPSMPKKGKSKKDKPKKRNQ